MPRLCCFKIVRLRVKRSGSPTSRYFIGIERKHRISVSMSMSIGAEGVPPHDGEDQRPVHDADDAVRVDAQDDA